MAARAMTLIAMMILIGCGKERQIPQITKFYNELKYVELTEEERRKKEELITISAQNMPFRDFIRELTDVASVSVISEHGLDDKLVTLDVREVPVKSVITLVARRLGVSVTGTNGLYFIGQLRPEDKGYFVTKIPRLSPENIQKSIEVLLGEFGRVVVMEDGLTVVADRVEVITRVVELVKLINSAEVDSWVVQLHIVAISDSDSRQLGIDFNHQASASYAINKSIGSELSKAGDASALLGATLRAVTEKSKSSIFAQPTFILLDGKKARIHQGERTPIRQQTVTDSGTVTTTGFEFIDTGIMVDAKVRHGTGAGALMELDISVSQIAGFVANEAPIVLTSSITTAGHIQSGGVYLVGSLKVDQVDRSGSGMLFNTSFNNSDSQKNLQVWATCYRIGGPRYQAVDRQAAPSGLQAGAARR